MSVRTIVHLDLDSFFVSVERLLDSSLNGKPVIIGGSSDRGVVASCSYEARKFGVHSAMPTKLAKQLCPEAVFIKGDHEQYSKYSKDVTTIINEKSPVVEKASIDEHYIDISGMERFIKPAMQWAKELKESITKETGLPISFGLSTSKTVAKVGTNEAKPNGEKEIPFGTEKTFLAPLSVKKIPMVGDKTYMLLRNMGVAYIYTLQQMPVELMEQVLGQNGIVIWKKANAIDNIPVEPYSERKSISTERTFDKDTTDVKVLKQLLISMTEKLAFQLRSEQKLTSCVTVKIRYSDFNTFTMQARLPYTSLDHVLIEKVKELFEKLYQKRILIRLIGVRFSHLVQGTYQYNLFEQSIVQLQLYEAMDRMRKRYGNDAVQRAVGLNIKHSDFNPFNGIKR